MEIVRLSVLLATFFAFGAVHTWVRLRLPVYLRARRLRRTLTTWYCLRISFDKSLRGYEPWYLRVLVGWFLVSCACVSFADNSWHVSNPHHFNVECWWVDNPGYPYYGGTVPAGAPGSLSYTTGDLNAGPQPVPGSSQLIVWVQGYGQQANQWGSNTIGGSAWQMGGNMTIPSTGPMQVTPNVDQGISIGNSSPEGATFQMYDNGLATGTYVYVPPGGVANFDMSGGFGDSMTAQPMGAGTVSYNPSAGGGEANLGGGAMVVTNGTFTPSAGTVGTNSNYINTDSGNPTQTPIKIGTNYTSSGSGTVTNGFITYGYTNTDIPIALLTNGLPTTETNGIINFYNPSNTSAANNGTLQQGFNGIATAYQLDTSAIVQAIQTADHNNQAGQAAIENDINHISNSAGGTGTNNITITNNNVVSVTNVGHDYSNQLSQIIGNTDFSNRMILATNLLGTFDTNAAWTTATTAANGQYGPLNSAVAGMTPGSYTPGSIADMSITIGAGNYAQVLDCNPLHIAGVSDLASWCRLAFTFLVALFAFRDGWGAVERYLAAAGSVRQATTAGGSLDGFNLNTAWAQAMAIAITAAVAVIPAAFVTWLGTTNFVSVIAGGMFSSSVGSGFAMLDAFMPLDYIVTTAVTVVLFRVSVGGVWWVVAAIVRHMTGL